MAACKVCGEIYGVLDLKDGICKSCLNNHSVNNMSINSTSQYKEKTVVKQYIEKELKARELFEKDKKIMIKNGYQVISENFVPGQYSVMDFIIAVLLFVLVIGFFIFIYMIIIKPKGVLIVTYELKEDSKICPVCAETVRINASKCRFCGYAFSDK